MLVQNHPLRSCEQNSLYYNGLLSIFGKDDVKNRGDFSAQRLWTHFFHLSNEKGVMEILGHRDLPPSY